MPAIYKPLLSPLKRNLHLLQGRRASSSEHHGSYGLKEPQELLDILIRVLTHFTDEETGAQQKG